MPEGRHEGQGHWMDDQGSLLWAGDWDVLVKTAYLHKDFKIKKKNEITNQHTQKRGRILKESQNLVVLAFAFRVNFVHVQKQMSYWTP